MAAKGRRQRQRRGMRAKAERNEEAKAKKGGHWQGTREGAGGPLLPAVSTTSSGF